MVKNDSLSFDIDLIKELESLRIKQKLLVESLTKKSGNHENILLSHIDAKLEFLVKIFQDTSTPNHEKPGEDSDENSENSEVIPETETFEDKVFSRLTAIEDSMISRFNELNEKISNLKISKTETSSALPSQSTTKTHSSTSAEMQLPPVPTFKNETNGPVKKSEEKVPESLNEDSIEKKKWF
jgi:hypothetical protein